MVIFQIISVSVCDDKTKPNSARFEGCSIGLHCTFDLAVQIQTDSELPRKFDLKMEIIILCEIRLIALPQSFVA